MYLAQEGLAVIATYLPILHGSLNVPIEHHPTIRYMVYNGYYKVMSNIPKMGHLPTPILHVLHLTMFFTSATQMQNLRPSNQLRIRENPP